MTLTESGAGTGIAWRSTFRGKLPVPVFLVRAALARFIREPSRASPEPPSGSIRIENEVGDAMRPQLWFRSAHPARASVSHRNTSAPKLRTSGSLA